MAAIPAARRTKWSCRQCGASTPPRTVARSEHQSVQSRLRPLRIPLSKMRRYRSTHEAIFSPLLSGERNSYGERLVARFTLMAARRCLSSLQVGSGPRNAGCLPQPALLERVRMANYCHQPSPVTNDHEKRIHPYHSAQRRA